MRRVLLAYSTVDGHTLLICRRIAALLEQRGHQVVVKDIAACEAGDVSAADLAVIGASIRYGKHRPDVAAFAERHRAALDARPNAFFSVNVVARKPGKDRPEGNPYLQKWLRQVSWKPRRLGVFAGCIDYPSLGALDRTMIRLIMWITKGPTDPTAVVEFTDWGQVEAFALALHDDLARIAPAHDPPAPV
jgi:menaquinone-dependent protoporphyrinogen oxidase